MSRILSFITLLSLYCLLAVPVLAQEPAPDYRIEGSVEYTGETGATILYTVINDGGSTDEVTLVELTDLSGKTLDQRPLRALDSNEQETGSIPFPINQFPADWYPPGIPVNVLLVVDGDSRVETNAATRENNTSRAIEVRIPQAIAVTIMTPPPATATPTITGEETFSERLERELQDRFNLDTSSVEGKMIASAILASGTIVFLLIWLSLRIVFGRRPQFGNWQPPYATMPPLDPNSTYGRRQAWQQHANHNTIPTPCQPGTAQARKVLLGTDGRYLSGWQVLALRLTQFDMYGRVSRSQVLASKRSVSRLNGLAKKAGHYNEKKLTRKVRPVAKSLAKDFRKKINQRSAMLPSALDIRLRGVHGEVRILFELYDCKNGQPYLLDRWEPEMMVTSMTIYESYTCTMQGQRGDESYKAFRKRLTLDLERVLMDVFRLMSYEPPQPLTPASTTPAVQRQSMPPAPPVDTPSAGQPTLKPKHQMDPLLESLEETIQNPSPNEDETEQADE